MSNGRAPGWKVSRCESTTWKTSPAAMYSFARRTAARKPARLVEDFGFSFRACAAPLAASIRRGTPRASLRSNCAMSRAARS